MSTGTLVVIGFFGVLFLLPVLGAFFSSPRAPLRTYHVRGSRLTSLERARSMGRRLLAGSRLAMLAFGVWIPIWLAVPNFLFLGVHGSGKSALIWEMLATLLWVRGRLDRFYVIHDPKRENVGRLLALGVHPALMTIANPFDARRARWEIREDSPRTEREELFHTLFPVPENSTHEFWEGMAAQVATALSFSFDEIHYPWQLRDIVLGMMAEPAELRQIIALAPENGPVLRDILQGRADLALDSKTTLTRRASKYALIAALWHEAPTSFSVKKLISRPGILLLPQYPVAEVALRMMNGALMKKLTTEILTLPVLDERDDRVWFVLDELGDLASDIGELLRKLLSEGRDRGARMIAAVQSIPSLQAAWSGISPKNVEAFLGAFGHVCACKIDEVETTGPLLEKRFGISEQDRPTYSESTSVNANGERSGSAGFSYTREANPLIRATEIEELPLPGPKNRAIWAACHMDLGGPANFWTRRTFAQLSRTTPRPTAEQRRWNFILVDESAAKLKPWTAVERRCLGLDGISDDAGELNESAKKVVGPTKSAGASPASGSGSLRDLDFR